MNWKNFKYWQKGFLIGVVIHILYFSLFIPWILRGGGETLLGWMFILTELLPLIATFPFLEQFLGESVLGLFITGLMVTMLYGFVGALVGLLVSKVKFKR